MELNKMKTDRIKPFLLQNWIYYAAGAALVLGIKYGYSRSSCDGLRWILTPTARWVRALSGIPFEYESQVGYISYTYRFIIAASCSGVQFMTIAFAALAFSFVRRMKTAKGRWGWMAFSLGFSYLFTVFVNGIRIILSIYLPVYLPICLHHPDILRGWMNPGRLHTMIGTVTYFTSLCVACHMAGSLSWRLARASVPARPFPKTRRAWLSPVFWYFLIVLGIPFLNKAYLKGGARFTEYAALVAAVCLVILALWGLVSALGKQIGLSLKAGRRQRSGRGMLFRKKKDLMG